MTLSKVFDKTTEMPPKANSEWSQEGFEADRRSMASLWNEAQLRFTTITSNEYVKFTNTKDILQYGSEQMDKFHRFRHNQGKVDKLRRLFASNMEYVEAGTKAIASAASGAFPPAAVIGTALVYVLGACKKVSADYDLLTDFFEDMNNFLQRVSIIEKRIPDSKPYQNSLVDVFAFLVEMCAHAGKEILDGRLKKWFLKALSLDKSDIGGTKKKMETALSRLQSATEFAILDNTEKLNDLSQDLRLNQERHDELLKAQTHLIESGFQSMDAELKKIIIMLQKQDAPRTNLPNVSGKDKVATMRKIENFFDFKLSVLEKIFDDIRDVSVTGTCQWLFEELAWNAWISQDDASSKLLIVDGNRGSGKTHLAISIYEHLQSLMQSNLDAPKVCVGCVLFRDRVDGLDNLFSAMAAITIQIAQQNTTLCERINAEMAKTDGKVHDWGDIWNKYIFVHFQRGSPYYLQLVIDGIDELADVQMKDFFKFINNLNQMPTIQICAVMLIRHEHLSNGPESATEIISIRTLKQKSDYDAIIQDRMTASRRLRNLDNDIKQKIVEKLQNSSDSILYLEYMLRNFKTFERRSSLLKQINTTLPPDLEHIYLALLTDYERRLAEQQLEAAGIVLMWVAFALVHPTLNEITALLEHTGHHDFQLEEELQQSQIRRFLVMKPGNTQGRSSLNADHDLFKMIREEGDANGEYQDGVMLIHFWDRSMRDFFRSLSQYEPGLRTVKSEAHRRMFVICSEILRKPSKTKSNLLMYASEYWLAHHAAVVFNHHDHAEQVEFLEATALLLDDSSHLSENLVAADIDFLQIRQHVAKDGDALLSIKDCLTNLSSRHRTDISETALLWFTGMEINSQYLLLPVARGLIRHWLRTENIMQMYKPYWFVRCCVIVAGLPPFEADSSAERNSHTLSKEVYMSLTTVSSQTKEITAPWDEAKLPSDEIEQVVQLLPEPLTFEAYIVMYKTIFDKFEGLMGASEKFELIMVKSEGPKDHTNESSQSQQSFSKAKIVLGMALGKVADNYYYDGYNDQARLFWNRADETISECLNDNRTPVSLRALAYVVLADLKFQLDLHEEGFVAHAKFREFSGADFIDSLTIADEVRRTRKWRTDEEAHNLIKSWRLVDALACMTCAVLGRENHPVSLRRIHMMLQRIGAATNDRQFLIQRYQEVIQVLKGALSAAPIEIELSNCYQYVYGDVSTAKTILDDVLDGAVSGDFYLLTNEEPEWILGQAINKMSDIFYEEFRATTSPELKLKLYENTEGLLLRNLATHVTSSASILLHHTITQARMLKRLGPAAKFQTVLDQAFQTCYESLTDSVGWNDQASLVNLCKILALMDGFEEETVIAMSARFSILNSSEDSTTAGNYTSNYNQHEEPQYREISDEEEFDFIEGASFCDGSICVGDEPYIEYDGPTLYNCLICSSCFLCEECYKQRLAWNEAETKNDEPNKAANSKKPSYCGLNHKYIAGPIAGWRGVKDGVMYIDGRTPMKFVTWLKELKFEKWPKAWDKFWLTEGVAG